MVDVPLVGSLMKKTEIFENLRAFVTSNLLNTQVKSFCEYYNKSFCVCF